MGNCLVTKLKSEVDNPNIPILGTLRCNVISGTNVFRIKALTESECVVTGKTGITFLSMSGSAYTNPLTLKTTFNGLKVVSANNNGVVEISNKYSLLPIIENGMKTFGFSGLINIDGGINSLILWIPSDTEYLMLHNNQMSLNTLDFAKSLNKTSIKQFEVQNSNISGDISDFALINSIENIGVSYCTNIVGDIAGLGSKTTITNIALHGSRVSGTIESFVAGQRAAGRTTGSVSGNSAGWGLVTFNGATTHAKGIVTWDATTITMDGVTINA